MLKTTGQGLWEEEAGLVKPRENEKPPAGGRSAGVAHVRTLKNGVELDFGRALRAMLIFLESA